ncbi:hypothetical protein [Merismopedia glauca]|uniref:Uncharacterized protein n=1 Tax=Merismopedia glauca CCAP 1448/3 TaxID=1296344 RepID=A0A2T1BYK1_9CYAN|nr:hypothetical protein [Merismopedia glauca]PSB01110.1 hypothetical protein C7B64_20040 [Merismopedia glauca CCAP 1448/3]
MSDFDSEVTLREIAKENLGSILRLKVAPHQQQFVASNAESLAQAHFEPELPWFRAIYAGVELESMVLSLALVQQIRQTSLVRLIRHLGVLGGKIQSNQ